MYALECAYVEVPEHAYRFGEGHDKRAGQVGLHQLDEGEFGVVAGPVSVVIFGFSSFLASLLQDGGLVALFHYDQEAKSKPARHHDDPVGPTPSFVLCHKSALGVLSALFSEVKVEGKRGTYDNWPQNWPIHRTDTPYRKRCCPVFIANNIRNGAW